MNREACENWSLLAQCGKPLFNPSSLYPMGRKSSLILAAALLIAAGLYWFLSSPTRVEAPAPAVPPTGGSVASTSTQMSTTDAIKQLFVDKYNKPLSEIYVVVNAEDATHAGGMVTFGANGLGEGGIWFAAKVHDAWTLVFDGNGSLECALVDQYQFPMSMVGECLEKDGELRH